MVLPTVEVRFKDLYIETALYTDTERNLPTILNSYRSALEVRPPDNLSEHLRPKVGLKNLYAKAVYVQWLNKESCSDQRFATML